MKTKIGVVIAIQNKQEQFLIIKRAEHDTMPGIWEFPGGGLDQTDNSILHAAKREVLEETGLTLHDIAPLGFNDRLEKEQSRRDVLLQYYSNNFSGDIKLSEDHSDFKWINKEDILKMKTSKKIGIDSHILLTNMNTNF